MWELVPPLLQRGPPAGVRAGLLAIAALVSPLAGTVLAQSYPDKPIRLIVPAGPGGPTDVPARLLSLILPKLGQPVVIENRAGAGGAVGARAVVAATPDGYTLLVGNTSVLAVAPAVSASAGYVRCLPRGCYAEVVMDDTLIGKMKTGQTATFFIFQTPEEGIGFPMGLKGFGDGYDKLP